MWETVIHLYVQNIDKDTKEKPRGRPKVRKTQVGDRSELKGNKQSDTNTEKEPKVTKCTITDSTTNKDSKENRNCQWQKMGEYKGKGQQCDINGL